MAIKHLRKARPLRERIFHQQRHVLQQVQALPRRNQLHQPLKRVLLHNELLVIRLHIIYNLFKALQYPFSLELSR